MCLDTQENMVATTRKYGCNHGHIDVYFWQGKLDGLCDETFCVLFSQETMVAALAVIFFMLDKRRILAFF